MTERKVRICDHEDKDARIGGKAVQCRLMSDGVCDLCGGDFCDEHLKTQSMALHLDFIRMVQPPNPNEQPRANHTAINTSEIYLCPQCFTILGISHTGQHQEGNTDHEQWAQITAIISSAKAEMVEMFKALWAKRALTKDQGDGA